MVKNLRLKAFHSKTEQIVNIEEAENWDYNDLTAMVVVENQLVHSYQELLEIASRAAVRDKEVLDVQRVLALAGG